MIKGVSKVKEIVVAVPNKVGTLATLTQALAKKSIDVWALTASTNLDQATIQLVTSNNTKALKVIAELGWSAHEREIVQVQLVNKVGAAETVSLTLASADINIESIYGSTLNVKAPAVFIVPSDVSRAVKVLKSASA